MARGPRPRMSTGAGDARHPEAKSPEDATGIPTIAPFLAAQAASPLDSAAMLILADWHEERGDIANAESLRGLAGAGFASLPALAGATWTAFCSEPDQLDYADGTGWGFGDEDQERTYGPRNDDCLRELEPRFGLRPLEHGKGAGAGERLEVSYRGIVVHASGDRSL